ncbi:MAG TPA: fructosamine kinase family protein [Ilumatobacter sp.]|jgi:fructosamine-3-kinase|nr:fructosamine kinase family protein [Ilumatobacter sp.]
MVVLDVDLAAAVEAALGSAVGAASRVHGGDVAIAFAVDLADRRRVFVKTHLRPPAEFFTTEATGLAWLGAAEALDVPRVLAVSDAPPAFLALEWVERGLPASSTEADLGLRLADLHRAGAPCFGREDRRSTGSRALPNPPTDTWVEFYASNRLLPLATLAADGGALPPTSIERLEALAGRLDVVGGPPEPPARLHGDLWHGNRLVGPGGRSWLIDPAAHGGHREFDLAMMRLFGGFGDDCFAAYAEAFPLTDGWQERVALHQIAPLVVHAIKFGGGYVDAAAAAIDRYI